MTLSGQRIINHLITFKSVLIPLLVDDPLWGVERLYAGAERTSVLIPLLVDDPLWVGKNYNDVLPLLNSLNPSFSG